MKRNDWSRKRTIPKNTLGISSKLRAPKTPLGKIRSGSLDVSFSAKDRQNHTHILGSTGSGKSKFLELLIRKDLKNPNAGLCLIDPHGSLYDEILLYASHSNIRNIHERIVLFNPAHDLDHVVGFNPIYKDADPEFLSEMLLSSCLKVWGQDNVSETPRIATWLPNIFYPLIKKNLSLVEAMAMVDMGDGSKRSTLLQGVHNTNILDDWYMFEKAAPSRKSELIEGSRNRLRRFFGNATIRNILGQTVGNIDLKSIMDEGKILLVNLSGAEKMTPDNAQLLGVLLVNEIFRVAKLRDDRDPKLKPFYCYIDEFSQFMTRDIGRALDQTRKYKVFMLLAHQHLSHLKEHDLELYASVMTNCKNKAIFGGLSSEDAQVMADELHTGFLNLKRVKHEMYSTRVAYSMQTRTSESVSEGTETSRTWNETSGESVSKSSEKSEQNNRNRSTSQTRDMYQTGSYRSDQTEASSQVTGATKKRRKYQPILFYKYIRYWGKRATFQIQFSEHVLCP